VAFKTSVGFVDHIWELLAPLLSGADMQLLPEAAAAASGSCAGTDKSTLAQQQQQQQQQQGTELTRQQAPLVLQPEAFLQLLVEHRVTHLVSTHWYAFCDMSDRLHRMRPPSCAAAFCQRGNADRYLMPVLSTRQCVCQKAATSLGASNHVMYVLVELVWCAGCGAVSAAAVAASPGCRKAADEPAAAGQQRLDAACGASCTVAGCVA
jgi:hypothetical protein